MTALQKYQHNGKLLAEAMEFFGELLDTMEECDEESKITEMYDTAFQALGYCSSLNAQAIQREVKRETEFDWQDHEQAEN